MTCECGPAGSPPGTPYGIVCRIMCDMLFVSLSLFTRRLGSRCDDTRIQPCTAVPCRMRNGAALRTCMFQCDTSMPLALTAFYVLSQTVEASLWLPCCGCVL